MPSPCGQNVDRYIMLSPSLPLTRKSAVGTPGGRNNGFALASPKEDADTSEHSLIQMGFSPFDWMTASCVTPLSFSPEDDLLNNAKSSF